MSHCEHLECRVEFGVLNHEYNCSLCSRSFCDDHACSYSYLTQFGGLHLPAFEKVINEKGYICKSCFSAGGLDLASFERSVFDRICAHPDCDVSFRNIFNATNACLSCGKLYCRKHGKLTKEDVGSAWLREHTHFPLAERVCMLCHGQKNAEYSEREFAEHQNIPSLKLMSGSAHGEKQAIVVHGILSSYEATSELCSALVSRGGFDTVWGFDDISYHGRVNEAKGLSITDIPTSVSGLLVGLASTAAKKVLEIVNLPAYIVEGAARNLFLSLKLLDKSNVTIIGHSLGGLVARCAVETYDVSLYVNTVITLASPHQLWLVAQRGNLLNWKGTPNENIRYLAVLGKDDWVSRESYSNFTSDDDRHRKLFKILIKGDHASIHAQPIGTYVPELINGFMSDFEKFYVEVHGAKPFLRYAPFHGASSGHAVDFPSGKWIEFNPGKM